jgi:predicted enzyme related to lactoylglutathione lyase
MTTAIEHKPGELYYFLMPSPDVERGRKFFSAVLGWEFKDDGADPEGTNPAGGLSARHKITTVWICVDDVERAVKAVRDGGGEATDAQESPSGWWADCKSPDGVAFSLGRMRPGFLDDWHPGPMDRHGNMGYFTVPVRDLWKAKVFYSAAFGWTYNAEHSNENYAHIQDSIPGGGLVVGEGDAPSLYFRVDDINAAVAATRENGGTANEPSESPSGWSASCTDDQGTAFNLWQPASGL